MDSAAAPTAVGALNAGAGGRRDARADRPRPGLGALARADRPRHARDQGAAARCCRCPACCACVSTPIAGSACWSGSMSPKARCARPASAAVGALLAVVEVALALVAVRGLRVHVRARLRADARGRRRQRARGRAMSLLDDLRAAVGAAHVHRRRRPAPATRSTGASASTAARWRSCGPARPPRSPRWSSACREHGASHRRAGRQHRPRRRLGARRERPPGACCRRRA